MNNDFDSMFQGIEHLVNTKTVIGEPMKLDDAIIVPIMEVTFGMATGSFSEGTSKAGAMSAKMTPVALMISQNGFERMVYIKNADAVSKVVDMIPGFINKLKGKGVSKDVVEKAKKAADDFESEIDTI